MEQFGPSAFNMVVWWRELDEVENECTSHNSSLFAIFLPKIKIGGNLTKFWQKQFCTVFWDTVYNTKTLPNVDSASSDTNDLGDTDSSADDRPTYDSDDATNTAAAREYSLNSKKSPVGVCSSGTC